MKKKKSAKVTLNAGVLMNITDRNATYNRSSVG